MKPRLFLTGLVTIALTASACNRTLLNIETSFDLNSGEYRKITVDPAPREQKIKVDVTSSAVPVSVFVFLQKDEQAAERDIEARKPAPTGVLVSREKTQNANMEVPIPANSPAVVMITRATKATHVTVKLTN